MNTSESPTWLVAAEIRAELGRQRMSQTELADALGMPVATLRRRLNAEIVIDVNELWAMARALGVPVQRLLPDRVPVR